MMPLQLLTKKLLTDSNLFIISSTTAFKLAHSTMNQDQSSSLAESLAPLSVSGTSIQTSNPNPDGASKSPRKHRPGKGKEKEKPDEAKLSSNHRDKQPKRHQPGAKLRGQDRDSPDVRISKTLSWLLRHGAQSEGLEIRTDGYVKVDDLVWLSYVLPVLNHAY